MPGYAGTGQAVLLRENEQKFCFQQEPTVPNEASVAFQLERISRTFYPWGASFELSFTDVNRNPADPGVFEVDIEVADSDRDAAFLAVAQITGVSASFVGRYDLTNLFPKYVRARVVDVTNTVFTTLMVTR